MQRFKGDTLFKALAGVNNPFRMRMDGFCMKSSSSVRADPGQWCLCLAKAISKSLCRCRYPQGHALLVGVSKYQRISSLPDAILNDVKDVAATLSSPKYCGYAQENVVSLFNADATRNAVLEGLSDLAARAAEDDTVCVYFSGHGTVFTSPGGDDSALLTVDSDLSDVAGTAISSGDLAAALGQIKAERVLVFIDSCHAGGNHPKVTLRF
jgi:hypothetical protein